MIFAGFETAIPWAAEVGVADVPATNVTEADVGGDVIGAVAGVQRPHSSVLLAKELPPFDARPISMASAFRTDEMAE